MVHLAVGHLCGSGALGQALERRGCAGDRRDGVEQYLGRQELGQGVRDVQVVVSVQLVGVGRELVGPAARDRPDQALEAGADLDECAGQAVEQLVVGGWVGVAKVVHGLDDPASQQVEPDPIDQVPCEEGVFLAGEPRRQADAAVRLDVFKYRPAECLRLSSKLLETKDSKTTNIQQALRRSVPR